MNKISVGETILRGYGFAVRRIFGNLGLVWLAAVFYAVAADYWLHQFCTTMLVSPHPGSELNDFALFDLFCLVVVTALGNAVMARTLTGAALEPGGETMTAYFALAKREWILFLSLLRSYVLIIAAVAAVALLGRLAVAMALPVIGVNAQWQGIGALPAINAATVAVAAIVTAILVVRLGFFAAPVASAENSASMARTWSLSRGNSLRILAVILALAVPAFLLWAAAEWALVGNDLTDALSAGPGSNAFYRLIDSNVSIIAGVWTALLVILNMLCAEAFSSAYLNVRDNVAVRETPTAPILEPAFAGSFAGFAPRHAEIPAPDAQAFPVEMPVTEPEAVSVPTEDAAPTAEFHDSEAPMHEEAAHEPLTLADEVHELTPAPEEPAVAPEHVAEDATDAAMMPFPHGADDAAEHPVEHAGPVEHAEEPYAEPQAEAVEFTPPPSHGDETESSQQNVPSEAA